MSSDADKQNPGHGPCIGCGECCSIACVIGKQYFQLDDEDCPALYELEPGLYRCMLAAHYTEELLINEGCSRR